MMVAVQYGPMKIKDIIYVIFPIISNKMTREST